MDEDDRAAFAELIRGALPDRVITNFVLVAEVLTEDGAELTLAHSESITPWLGHGMLVCAQDLLQGAIGRDEDED